MIRVHRQMVGHGESVGAPHRWVTAMQRCVSQVSRDVLEGRDATGECVALLKVIGGRRAYLIRGYAETCLTLGQDVKAHDSAWVAHDALHKRLLGMEDGLFGALRGRGAMDAARGSRR